MPIQTRPNWTQLTNRPTTVAGFGITDGNPRAWVSFNGTGAVAIRASGNVSSITDNGVGQYTVNFATAMPDANYAVAGITGPLGGDTLAAGNYLAGSCRLSATDATGALLDASLVSLAIFR